MKEIRILFVCRYNRFRSRVAEAYFNKINKNKKIKARSAGLIQGYPVEKKTTNLLKKEFGINISGKTRGLNSKDISWQNITVIVADNVPEAVFYRNKPLGKRVIKYSVSDVSTNDSKIKIAVAKRIFRKVDKLVKQLNKELK